MNLTGMVRRLDPLGRIVIPKEFRDMLAVQNGDLLEMFLEDGYVIVRKYTPRCQTLQLAINNMRDSINEISDTEARQNLQCAFAVLENRLGQAQPTNQSETVAE